MFSAHTLVCPSLSLLLFNRHYPFILSLFSLTYASSTIYSSRSICVRIRLVDDNDDGEEIFLFSFFHASRAKRGREKRERGEE